MSTRVGDRLRFTFVNGTHRVVQVTGAASCTPVASPVLGDGRNHSYPDVLEVLVTPAMVGTIYVVRILFAMIVASRVLKYAIHTGVPG